MIEICGKQVRDTLEELLDPSVCALLVIDMQVDGVSRVADSLRPQLVDRCAVALAAARRSGVPVIHVRVANLPDGASSPPGWLRHLHNLSRGQDIDVSRLSVEGDPELNFVAACEPEPGEPVITKRRQSAFFGTDLPILLRGQGIETVAVIGIASTGCVEATMRDACHHDFYAVLLEDAVAGPVVERHEAVLTAMRHRHDVCAVDDAHRTWERAVARVLAGSRR
jgi:nicotinamidase-related amidase